MSFSAALSILLVVIANTSSLALAAPGVKLTQQSVEGEAVAIVDSNREDGTIDSWNKPKAVMNRAIYSRSTEGKSVAVVDNNRLNGTMYSVKGQKPLWTK
jgi:hypothetical protein